MPLNLGQSDDASLTGAKPKVADHRKEAPARRHSLTNLLMAQKQSAPTTQIIKIPVMSESLESPWLPLSTMSKIKLVQSGRAHVALDQFR